MLCREFTVSRMTARNAVQRLVQEGLVDRVPGRGTFVAVPPAHRRVDNLLSFSEQMRRRGQTAAADRIEVTVRPATDEEARRLALAAGGDVVVLRRLRLADRVPVADETAVLPGRLAAAIAGADWRTASLHELLVAEGAIPRTGRATITAESATAGDAHRLEVRRSTALLVERRLVLDADERPVELTESRYVASRYGLDVRFNVDLGRT
jgi:GntR family transcriptional regulator